MSRPVVGVVGAGQLARMTAQAAVSLDIELLVLATRGGDAACAAAAGVHLGDPGDIQALRAFGGTCDVLTFDHERVDPDAIAELEESGVVARPGHRVLAMADKARQRRRLKELGLPVPAFSIVTDTTGIELFASEQSWPVVAKLATGGYDGRGVFILRDAAEARDLVRKTAGASIVVEPMLELVAEIAVLVARRARGDVSVYPVTETRQVEGICVETIAPAEIDPQIAAEAQCLASRIASALRATGVLAVEMFLTPDGLLVNELAPRPHNSGHWTIEGAATSQFENHLRGILEWPLGDTSLRAPAVAMVNVIAAGGSSPLPALPEALAASAARVHLYGKQSRAGRKIGHVTALGPDRNSALGEARRAAAALTRASAGTPEMRQPCMATGEPR